MRLRLARGLDMRFQTSVRERLYDSHGRASALSRSWDCIVAYYPHLWRFDGSPGSSHSQGDRVTTLTASTLARARIAVATLLVLALLLGWVQRTWCATPADVSLVELARSKFANLSKAELALLRFAGANQALGDGFATAGPSSNPDDPSNDPAHADEWSKDREVHAAVIRWLCVDPEAIRLIDPQGLRLLGARIVGA